jgi:hypothetical protein
MNKKVVVYISSNDGSDMRINKEIQSLSKFYSVVFLGISETDNGPAFIRQHCYSAHILKGKRNHPLTVLKQIIVFINLICRHKIHSIHVVNEQLMIFFWPFLFFYHVVLDVFDSIFLRLNIEKGEWIFLKNLVYAPCNKVIVTDEVRKNLMPEFLQKKLVVLPNYPLRYSGPISKSTSEETLTILFFGWMGMSRGGSIAKGLLESDSRVKLIMAGWFIDDDCKELANHPRAYYRGIIPQAEALEIAATEADYILCLYEPLNQNMINASPNKIYDGIQTETPLLINKEVRAAALVEELNVGITIPSYYPEDFASLFNLMMEKKNSFYFPEVLKEKYTWEAFEDVLFSCHQK